MDKKVSIIIPVYNEEKYLDRCLTSLLGQSYMDTEIIVVDDASTDSSKNIIKKYPVKYFYQNHGGPAKAKNLGAKHATGEILAFADGDMYYDQNYIENLIQPILANQAVGTFSKEVYVANPENIWSQCYNLNLNLDIHRKVELDFPTEFIGFRTILKREFLKIGGFDNIGYEEDLSLFPKLKKHALSSEKAISYHYNPDTIPDVFLTARWVGRGNKYNVILSLARLVKYSLPTSIVVGFYKSLKYKKPNFFVFKIIWDFGVFVGIVNSLTTNQHAK